MDTTPVRARHALFITCALLAGTAFATPPPAKQNAAAGIVTAFYLREQLPWQTSVLVNPARDLADRALRLLAPATSPSQLLATAAGVSVPCPVSGSILARMAPRAPNVLKLQWVGCTYELSGWNHTLDGSGEITLLNLSFSPTVVAGIRLGDRDSDLVVKLLMLQSTQTVPDLNLHNLRMSGLISVERPDTDYGFHGASSFELSGFFEERIHFQVAGGGDQLFESRLTLSADNSYLSYTVAPNDGYDVRFGRGKLSYLSVFPETIFGPEQRTAYSFEPKGLRLRQALGAVGDDSFQIDGAVSVDWPDFFEMDCHKCTDFSYRTAVPMHRPPTYPQQSTYDAGEVWINGTTRAQFSVFEDEFFSEKMRVDVDARGRSFEFIVPTGGGWGELASAARCVP